MDVNPRDRPQHVDQSLDGRQVNKSVGEWATGESSSKLSSTDWSGQSKPGFEDMQGQAQPSTKNLDDSISSGEARMDSDFGRQSGSGSYGYYSSFPSSSSSGMLSGSSLAERSLAHTEFDNHGSTLDFGGQGPSSFSSGSGVDSGSSSSSSSMRQVASMISGNVSQFHSLSAKDASGQLFNFAQLIGRPVLIVNVALESRLASQFVGLQALYAKYQNQGLEILAFPCNQFGNAAPGSALELRDHIMRTYGVTFPIMEKVDVDGSGAHPVFRFLKAEKRNMLMEAVKWNFEKFLVDGKGHVVERWSSLSGVDSIDPYIARLVVGEGSRRQ